MSNVLKRAAAETAAAMVEDGMVVGLGTGSTAAFAVAALGHRVTEEGLKCVGIPTSKGTQLQAISLGIKISDLKAHPVVDLVIDEVDAVDLRSFSLIKGMGGALLREKKIVACGSRRMAVIVDPTKRAYPLGVGTPLPVEVVKSGWPSTKRRLESMGCNTMLRMGAEDRPKPTDGGNLTLDCYFGPIADPADLAEEIKSRVGVIESGLFVGMATDVIVGEPTGVHVFRRPKAYRLAPQLLGK